MRYSLIIVIVAAGIMLGLAGCNKPPAQPVEMSPAPEPEYNNDKPMLSEVRAVDQGDDGGDESAIPLSESSGSRSYVIQKGDTYWRIAATQLGNGHRWKEIEALNPGVNMNALKIGQTVRIPAK